MSGHYREGGHSSGVAVKRGSTVSVSARPFSWLSTVIVFSAGTRAGWATRARVQHMDVISWIHTHIYWKQRFSRSNVKCEAHSGSPQVSYSSRQKHSHYYCAD